MNKLWLESNWYVVQSRPHREDLAAMNLRRLGLEVLLPKIRQDILVWGVQKGALKPLFPRYLFARFCPAQHLHSIRYARGVKQILGTGRWILPVDDQIISEIRARLTNDDAVRLEDTSFRQGQRVIVEGGPLRGLRGIFEQETTEGDRVVILLQTVNCQARVLIGKCDLRSAVESL